jgi:hypothetical protein
VPDQVLEWERRIQLDREMALALDPAVGNEEAAELACEVGRLKTREAEVRQARAQKHAELQRAVERREVVELRVRAGVPFPCSSLQKGARHPHCQKHAQLQCVVEERKYGIQGGRAAFPFPSFLISHHAFLAKRQGASADELHVKAARILPLVGPARSKQDPITSGPWCLLLYRPCQPGPFIYTFLCARIKVEE